MVRQKSRMNPIILIIIGLFIILFCLLSFIGFYLFTTVRAETITADIVAENCMTISEPTDRQPYGMQTVVTTMNEVVEQKGDIQVALDSFIDKGIIQSYTIDSERIVAIMSDGTEWHYVLLESS